MKSGDHIYNHEKIEKKWQKYWESKKTFNAKDPAKLSGKAQKQKKFYSLIEFPYPSGDGLHVGHIRSNTAMDIISHKRRREGYNVLYPIGWDAFGLPTENYAIKTGIQPAVVTKKNTDIFRRQLKSLGFSFDYSSEINTSDPKYYKWTQWIFLQFLKQGLAYKKKMFINWCPKDLIGLANEEVVDGKCERCGTVVEKKEKEQWMLAITKYAERLDRDLDTVDFQERIKIQQRNWIGKSEGAEIDFKLNIPTGIKRVVLLHGYKGATVKESLSSRATFFPWLKVELEKQGIEVQAPELPNANNPKESEQVEHVLANCTFDEKTFVLGHSLGCVVAMKSLMKLNKPIAGLVLVASAIDPAVALKPRPFWNTFKWNYDFDQIKKLAPVITVVSDLQETHRAEYLRQLSRDLEAQLVETQAQEKHFCAKEEPELLKLFTPSLKVFTTRPNTIFGATYLVLSPEHLWVTLATDERHKGLLKNVDEIKKYIAEVKNKTEIERTAVDKPKTGIELKGVKAINPASGKEIPIWIADYVLAEYGTGAIMAVPAHDERDYAFAKKFDLPIKEVIIPKVVDTHDPPKEGVKVVERKAVQAIVIDPKNNKVLTLHWKKFPWTTFVTGGIEGNEDMIEAAKREIHEETGYKNVKYVKTLGGPVESHFYANHKAENRKATFSAMVFELQNEEKNDVSEKEKEIHEISWMTWDELNKDKNIKCAEYDIWIDRFFNDDHAFLGEGILVNSGNFSGKSSESIKKEITESVGGKWVVKYKLRDWIFSRQRYWGEPIPAVHCAKCGMVPLREKDLPLKLPKVKNYKPTETGESPLAAISKWVNTKCPNCKGPAKRETDTMPNWAGSSWYYLRYTDPKNSKDFASEKNLKYWTPVDWYNGGMEHTTLHLLYSRFWHKFLFDQGLVPTNEPYQKRTSHGLILAEGGEKMSKSKGNVINPDSIVKTVGADALRIYEMFMGPFDQHIAWDENGIVGTRRFIEKVWKLYSKIDNNAENKNETLIHKTIKKVSDDIESMKFNTAVSSLMILVNEMEKENVIPKENYEILLQLLAPFAPHVSEELWSKLGNKTSIHLSTWPEFDPSKLIASKVRIAIQINGKSRASFESSPDAPANELEKIALSLPEVQKWMEGKQPKKVIVVAGRLVNIVI